MSRIPMLALATALAGCVVSSAPVVDEANATFEPGLLGSWEEVDGGDRAVLSRGDGASYVIEITTDGATGRFIGRLGELGGHRVLDVAPAPPEGVLPEPYATLLVRGHILYAIELEGDDELRIAFLEPDVLGASLADGRVELAHDTTSDQLVLHGTTRELRDALGAYLREPGAFSEADTWRRVGSGGD